MTHRRNSSDRVPAGRPDEIGCRAFNRFANQGGKPVSLTRFAPLMIPWQGGACSHLRVQLPPNMADRVLYPAALVDRVRDLAQSLSDAQIADQLNQEGRISALGKPFTISMIKWIRHSYKIPIARMNHPQELTVQQVAERFGVKPNVVYYWIEHGVIQARRPNSGTPYWITLSKADEQKLRDWVRNSRKIHTAS